MRRPFVLEGENVPFENYAYCVPADAPDALVADMVNFETTFTEPVLWAPLRVTEGSEAAELLSGHERVDGWQEVSLEQVGDPFGFTKFTDLTAYVTAVHGGWAGEDAEICLRADDASGTFVYYNVIAHKPRLGTDYTHENSEYVRDLKLRYTVLSVYVPADL